MICRIGVFKSEKGGASEETRRACVYIWKYQFTTADTILTLSRFVVEFMSDSHFGGLFSVDN